jgi:acetoin utilization deacetylase AcuC-like enzyme
MDVLLLTHRACLAHDPGEDHPECPDRLRAVLKALDREEFAYLIRDEAPRVTLEQLCRVHPRDYVEAILAARPERFWTVAWRCLCDTRRYALDPSSIHPRGHGAVRSHLLAAD